MLDVVYMVITSLTYAVNVCGHIHVYIKPSTKIPNRAQLRNQEQKEGKIMNLFTSGTWTKCLSGLTYHQPEL